MFLLELFVFLVVMAVVIRPFYAAWFFVRPPRFRISFRTPESFAPNYETVHLTASDGADLDGWYLPSRNGAAVILLHGHGGNRLGLMFQAEVLARRGYGVLMFDLRAHGASGGKQFMLGEQTVGDVLTAVAYLSKRPDVKLGRIGVMGVSVGGALALHAASRTAVIHAVWADSPSMAALQDLPPQRSLFSRMLDSYYWRVLRALTRDEGLPPYTAVLPQIASRPLLLVATGSQREQEAIARLYNLASEPKKLWPMPQVGHANGWLAQPEQYAYRLAAFFDEALLPAEERLPLKEVPAAGMDDLETAVPAGYAIQADATTSMTKANLIALAVIPVAFIGFWLPYWMVWRNQLNVGQVVSFSVWHALLVIVASIVVHEVIHAVGFMLVGKAPRTAVKFGFSWRGLAPYAHCKMPMTMYAYRVSTALPGIVLGILPGIAGLIWGNYWLIWYAIFMLAGAGGDLAILLTTRHVPAHALVLDHPTKVGCLLVEKVSDKATSPVL
jgi:pimeloyl-ACP methyl ester carboxylesterase